MTIRDTLFGDLSLDAWCGNKPDVEPWTSFARAKVAFEGHNRDTAIAEFREVVAMPRLEARQYLQAWHFLRVLGVAPDEAEARKVLGVVVEVAMQEGVDLLAAYSDFSARYYNYSGAGVAWEHPNDSLDAEIRNVLTAGAKIAAVIGPWEGKRPAPPPDGQVRLNLLTPIGLMFGQASMEELETDPMAGPLLAAATELMIKLTEQLRGSP